MDGSALTTASTLERLPPRNGLVRRDALLRRLSAGSAGVVLVCAPAGSGKTVLLRSWIEDGGCGRVAWISLQRVERDAERFWQSVVGALAGAIGAGALRERAGPTPGFRAELVVDCLLSELEDLQEPAVLVIDDLHELHSADALASLERFVTHLPAGLRVVLATREDPPLGLHPLRLTGGLHELRGADLRFSLDEARELLEKAGISLSDEGAAMLHKRTEGWAAGLRLAAISMAEHPDPERFVTEFSGSERTVAGYLMAEVLERQSPAVRELLLRTSVLERVSGPLADFLTGGSGSERVLQQLEDTNAFVTSVDARRSWFRYHSLFADLLRLELRRVAPEIVDSLHHAAAQWHEAQGGMVEAIRHAQSARDWPHASRLLADNELSLMLDGRRATVRALLAAFPRHEVTADAELALATGRIRAFDGLLDDATAYLATAERLARDVPGERRPPFDLRVTSLRLLLARRAGDVNTALEERNAVEAALSAPREPRTAVDIALTHDARAAALMDLGIAELWSLRLDDARMHLEQALELAHRTGREYLEIGSLAHLAMTASLSGLPAAAVLALAERAVAVSETHGSATDPIAATAFAVGGNVLVRLARFDDAERWLERADHAADPGDRGTALLLHGARALLCLGQRRLDDAQAAFQTARMIRPLLAGEHALTVELRSRVLQAQVRAGEAAAARAGLDDMPSGERDAAGARIAAAAVHLAEGDPQQAIDELAPVIARTVPAVHPTWAAVEASVFEAAARDQLADRRAAEESIERALDLAEPDGMVLPFVLAPVGELLERHPRHRTAHAALLTSILDLPGGCRPQRPGRPGASSDALSDAELRVLRHLPSNLRAPEIASELFVSANTVRTHLRHIYAKLGAHNRSEAVLRARELRLIGPSPSRITQTV
jgi:LuxR family maltose regulon positive regulatory protein